MVKEWGTSACLSIRLSIRPFIRLSICLSIRLSIRLFLQVPAPPRGLPPVLLGPASPPGPVHRDNHPPANREGGVSQPVWCGEGRVWLPLSRVHG